MKRSHEQTVEVRDRRELPFFQVHLAAVRAIRQTESGPSLVRAIGFYALQCQLANEQRHTGEHRVVHFSYETLTRRSRAGRSTVKVLLDTLGRAGVIRCERVNDPARGAAVSLLHLQIHEGAWTAVTVAMAKHLASERPGGCLLRDLGLVVVLLELCCEQRAEHGGLRAETTRAAIAKRAGLTADRLDHCKEILERAGVVSIERRRAGNGGRHLPNTYTLHEAPQSATQGGEPGLAGAQTGTGRAADQDWQGGDPGLAGPRAGTARTADQDSQGGIAATLGPGSPPSNARTRECGVEKAVEAPPPQLPHDETPGGGADDPRVELCEALLSAWAPALGESPRRGYVADRERWLAAAGELLERHPRARLAHALDYMLGDEILGSRALTLPGFAKVADQLLARHHARSRRGLPAAHVRAAGMGWPAARELLERAVQRHGRDDRAGALAELATHSELFAVFVERVRWSVLCEQSMRYCESRYAQLWNELLGEHAGTRPETQA